uniref:Heat shock protein n=1 Tax=Potato yellow vein virus TaxID=103881 RepID=H6UWU0_9CLOS|nr:heat shock protein [Potato yellow vein virus]
MAHKAGLDFGTTFSTISSYSDGVMKVLKLNNSEYIPTCLSISDKGDVIIGGAAQVLDSGEIKTCYFYDLKRWVGVDKINYNVIKQKIKPAYVTSLVGNDVHITGINKGFSCTYTVKQLILLFIDTVVRLFSKIENLNIVSINVSVPADYKCKQRMFMRSVCDSLGFSLRRIINEPSAAAIYNVSKYPNYKYFIMYDFGGGTFDCSLITRDGRFVTVADTEGDSYLGGRDIDNAIQKYLMAKNKLSHPITSDFLASIKEECNSTSKTSFTVFDVNNRLKTVSFNKEDLAICTKPFCTRSLEILNNMIERNSITTGVIFLVGGSSLLKTVQDEVRSFSMKKNLECVIDKDLRNAVSFGCSMQHAQEDSGTMTYIDCNSHPLMDISMFGNPKIIIRKPMSVPYTHIEKRKVDRHYNTALNIYEGSDLFTLNNDWLISADVRTKDYCLEGQELSIKYVYNIDGMLDLYIKSNFQNKDILLKNKFSLTEKIAKLDLKLTQLSTIDEAATLVAILSYYNSDLEALLRLVKTPSLFESELSRVVSTKELLSKLVSLNKNFS